MCGQRQAVVQRHLCSAGEDSLLVAPEIRAVIEKGS